ncbi:condensation domain-containing protein [Streptosporangium sp. CA-115845]|uniref:acyl carrier protein n=1 Tax=Streptosporangium sp. CA-115845 TaxID=3240071 RepID=UPI003D93497C
MTAPTANRLPLTQSQKSLLLLREMLPVAHLYNTLTEVELDPSYTDDEVRTALAAVVAAQPALRTVMVDAPEPHAVLTEPPTAGELPFHSAPHGGDDPVGAAADRLATWPFDLHGGPLYRFCLVRADRWAVLLVSIHHIVFDGLSIRPLADDLSAALRGADVAVLREAREKALATELAGQHRAAQNAATLAQARDWAAEFRDLPEATLYPHSDRPADATFHGAHIRWTVDGDTARALAALCRGRGVSTFEFFSAIYAAVVARHSAVSAVVLGTPLMSRSTPGAFGLCGFFVNTLPLTVPVEWSAPFDEFVRSTVREAVRRTRSRAAVGFNQIVEHLRQVRTGNRNPVFSCVIAMQEGHPPRPDEPVRAVGERANGTAKFDCGLNVTAFDGGWTLDIEYDRGILPAEVAGAVGESLRTALDRALSMPDRPVADLFVDADPEGGDPSGGMTQIIDASGHLAPVGVPGRRHRVGEAPPEGDWPDLSDLVLRNVDGEIARIGDASVTGTTAPGGRPPDTPSPREDGYADDLEREVAELWMELLELPAIDPSHSLLEYGAHSLLVFTALSRVRRKYQVAVPIIEFFKEPTVTATAEAVRRRRRP